MDSIGNSSNEYGESSLDGGVKRACDQCRIRKIRCDKESPCSNCRTALRTCSSTGAGQKPKEMRQRVLISSQYERKIDKFEARLAGIESTLRELTTSLKGNSGFINNAEQQQQQQPGHLLRPSHIRTPGVQSHSLAPPFLGPEIIPTAGGSALSAGRAYATSSVSAAENTSIRGGNTFDASGSSDNDHSPGTNGIDGSRGGHGGDNGDGGDDDYELDSAFEGDSSLAAQTAQASEFLEHAVSRTTSMAGGVASASMQAALQSLQQIAALQRQRKAAAARESCFPRARPLPRGGVKELPMPPLPVVLTLLREIKEYHPITFTLVCAFIAVDSFIDACRRVYFATEDYSLATFIIVNIGLYYLFQEKAEMAGPTQAANLLEYHLICRDNAETALSNIPMLWPPRMENIEALLLSASYAVEKSKFTMAWQLNSAAASMCISLGWHRLPPGAPSDSTEAPPNPNSSNSNNAATTATTNNENNDNGTADTKSALFWFAYMLDKGLALRFGRASAIQDWDVGNLTPRELGPSAKVTTDRWRCVLNLWIRHAELMGATYEHLYSPRALARNPHERLASAHELIALLKRLTAESDDIARQFQAEAAAHKESIVTAGRGGGGDGSNRAGEGTGRRRSHNSSRGDNGRGDNSRGTGHRPGGGEGPGTGIGMAGGNGAFEEVTMAMVFKSDEVSYWSSMTLVYRAMPPSAPGFPSAVNAECIDAARRAFACHQECIRLTEKSMFMKAGYLHWTIHFAPFIPFISLFCHVIETSDTDDLSRLADFVDSLQPVISISEATEKLHRVCQLLYNVARLYVEAKAQAQGGGNDNNSSGTAQQDADMTMAMVGNDFDMYLSQLGFMPPVLGSHGSGSHHHGAGLTAEFDNEMPAVAAEQSSAQLDDWFSGNRHIMGLMEEDLSEFQPELWAPFRPS